MTHENTRGALTLDIGEKARKRLVVANTLDEKLYAHGARRFDALWAEHGEPRPARRAVRLSM
eukprot:4688281-Prymnesium_polylepis.1